MKLNIKKIFLFSFFFINFLFAEDDKIYNFYVNNTTMLDIYYNIFNGIVMLLSDNIYLSILKFVFLIGGFFIFMMGVFNILSGSDSTGKRVIFDFLKYMIYGVIILSILFSGKESKLYVKSLETPSYCSDTSSTSTSTDVYIKMPDTLAWVYSLMNRLGYQTTNVMKSYFNLPNNTPSSYDSYLSSIGGVGNLLKLDIPALTANTSKTPYFSTYFSYFVNRCIYNVASANSNGYLVINTMLDTGDTISTIDNIESNSSSSLVFFRNPESPGKTVIKDLKTDDGGLYKDIMIIVGGKTYSCGDFWNNKLKSEIDTLKGEDIQCFSALKKIGPSSIALFTPDIGLNNFKNIAVQAALSNEMLKSASKLGIGSINYTASKTLAEQAFMYIGEGMMMAHILPYFQAALRAIIYAFFPFVFIIILLPKGMSILKNYILTLVWVEMWLPIMAIILFIMSYLSQQDLSGIYSNHFNTLSFLTVFSDTAIIAGVMGYLMMFVPGIAWMILKASDTMITGMFSNLTARFAANLSNVDAYNKDIAEIKALRTANKDNLLKAKKIVSLAEADYMDIQQQQNQRYGSMMRLADFNDKEMFQSGYGEKGLEIASGLGGKKLIKSDIKTLAESKYIDSESKVVATENSINQISKELGISKDEAIEYISKMKGIKEYSDIMKKVSSGEALSEEDMTKLRKGYRNQEYKDIGKTKAFSTVSKETAETSGEGSGISEILKGMKAYNERDIYNLMHRAEANDNEFFLHNYGKEYAAAKVADEWIHHSGLFKALGMKMDKNNLYNYGDVVKTTTMLNKMGDGETLNLMKQSVATEEFEIRTKETEKESNKLGYSVYGKPLSNNPLSYEYVKNVVISESKIDGLSNAISYIKTARMVEKNIDIDNIEQKIGDVLGKKEVTLTEVSSINKIKHFMIQNLKDNYHFGKMNSYSINAIKNLNNFNTGNVYADVMQIKALFNQQVSLYKDLEKNEEIAEKQRKDFTVKQEAEGEIASIVFDTLGKGNLLIELEDKIGDENFKKLAFIMAASKMYSQIPLLKGVVNKLTEIVIDKLEESLKEQLEKRGVAQFFKNGKTNFVNFSKQTMFKVAKKVDSGMAKALGSNWEDIKYVVKNVHEGFGFAIENLKNRKELMKYAVKDTVDMLKIKTSSKITPIIEVLSKNKVGMEILAKTKFFTNLSFNAAKEGALAYSSISKNAIKGVASTANKVVKVVGSTGFFFLLDSALNAKEELDNVNNMVIDDNVAKELGLTNRDITVAKVKYTIGGAVRISNVLEHKMENFVSYVNDGKTWHSFDAFKEANNFKVKEKGDMIEITFHNKRLNQIKEFEKYVEIMKIESNLADMFVKKDDVNKYKEIIRTNINDTINNIHKKMDEMNIKVADFKMKMFDKRVQYFISKNIVDSVTSINSHSENASLILNPNPNHSIKLTIQDERVVDPVKLQEILKSKNIEYDPSKKYFIVYSKDLGSSANVSDLTKPIDDKENVVTVISIDRTLNIEAQSYFALTKSLEGLYGKDTDSDMKKISYFSNPYNFIFGNYDKEKMLNVINIANKRINEFKESVKDYREALENSQKVLVPRDEFFNKVNKDSYVADLVQLVQDKVSSDINVGLYNFNHSLTGGSANFYSFLYNKDRVLRTMVNITENINALKESEIMGIRKNLKENKSTLLDVMGSYNF